MAFSAALPKQLIGCASRARIEVGKHTAYAYTDRRGVVRLPFDEALNVARRFSAAEPATVLIAIEGTEAQMGA